MAIYRSSIESNTLGRINFVCDLSPDGADGLPSCWDENFKYHAFLQLPREDFIKIMDLIDEAAKEEFQGPSDWENLKEFGT